MKLKMIKDEISRAVVTVGPDPEAKGGMAQVLKTYYCRIFPNPQYIVEARPGGKIAKLLQFASSMWQLRSVLKYPKTRIVHIHSASGISFRRSAYYINLAHRAGCRVVLHLHGGKFQEWYSSHRKEADKVFAKVDCIVALSDEWAEYYRGIGLKEVVVIPNVVDEPRPLAVESDGKVHALFMGLFEASKGLFDLLEAVGRQQERLRGKFMLHLGGRGQEDFVAAEIERLGIADMVVVEGWVAGTKKDALLSLADIFVLPSHFEGVPISILEAMTHGISIVATRVGGIPGIVTGENGLLCEAGDVAALGQNLIKLVESSELRQNMGRASLRLAEAYKPEAVACKLEELYRSLL